MSLLPVPTEFNVADRVRITTALHPMRMARTFSYVEAGKTVTEVVDFLCPDQFRNSVLVEIDGVLIERELWDATTVVQNNVVVLRAIPQGGDTFTKIIRSVLQLALLAFAVAVGFVFGPLAGVAAEAIGNLLINALIPPSSVNRSSPQYTFGVQGIQNQELPYGVVPRIYGRTLMTPPKGAHSYTYTTGSKQWLYALFDLGPGPINISDIKIGQTPIDDFADVVYETREGRATDAPLSFFTQAVTQVPLSIGLFANGDNATQRTNLNTDSIEVDITCPGGLFQTDSKGNIKQAEVDIFIEVHEVSTGATVFSNTFNLKASSTSSVSQTFSIGKAVTGFEDFEASQYDIKVTRTNNAGAVGKGADEAYWTALRFWGPSDVPLLPQNRAKIAVKILATEQLNGDIANLNCIAQSYAQVYDGTTFSEQLNTHPAWAAYAVMTGSSNARALDSSRIDLGSLWEWAQTYPEAEFNYVFSNRTTVWEALRTIGSAGRATPVVRDGMYGFIFDRVQDTPVQMFTARNVSGFKASRTYIDEVQGMEIRYIAETLGWQQHSIYVYADGITQDNVDFSQVSTLELTGITSDDWAYKLGSYFFASAVLRNTVYTFITDLDHLACNPGDRVWVQHDVISSGVASGRLTALTRDDSNNITAFQTDEKIVGDGESDYSIIVRTGAGGICTIPVEVAAAETNVYVALAAYNDGADPIDLGDLASIVTSEVQLLDAVVKSISPQVDFQATVTVLDYAPTIHSGDSVVPPPVVNDRTQKFIQSLPISSVRIISLTADETTSLTSSNGALTPRIYGVFQPNMDGLPAAEFELQYQVDGDIGWTAMPDMSPSARDFYIPISFNSVGVTFNVRIRGADAAVTNPSTWTEASIEIVDYLVQPDPPTALTITPIIGGVTATITSSDDTIQTYRLYINTTEDFETSSIAGESTTSTIQVTGLSASKIYVFYATTINGAGVESEPVGPETGLPLPVGYDDLKPDVTDFLDFLGQTAREQNDAMNQVAEAIAMIGLGSRNDVKKVTTLFKTADSTLFTNLTDGYNTAITTALTPYSSVLSDITSLQTALGDLSGDTGLADAVTELQTRATTDEGLITENSSAITGLQDTLTGYSGDSTVSTAITGLQTQITDNGSSISSNSSAITGLQDVLNGYSGLDAVANAITAITDGVNAGNSVLVSGTAPTTRSDGSDLGVGDLWVDTAHGNRFNTWDGSEWQLVPDLNKNSIFVQDSAPTANNVNDIWIDTTGGANTMSRWNGTDWVAVDNPAISANSSSITTLTDTIGGSYNPTSTIATAISGLSTTVTNNYSTLSSAIEELGSGFSGGQTANRVKNGSAELGDLTDWENVGQGQWTASTDVSGPDFYCPPGSTASTGVYNLLRQEISFTIGETISAAGQFNTLGLPSDVLTFRVWFADSGGSSLQQNTTTLAAAQDWTYLEIDAVVVPTGTVHAYVDIYFGNTAITIGSAGVSFRQIQVNVGSVPSGYDNTATLAVESQTRADAVSSISETVTDLTSRANASAFGNFIINGSAEIGRNWWFDGSNGSEWTAIADAGGGPAFYIHDISSFSSSNFYVIAQQIANDPGATISMGFTAWTEGLSAGSHVWLNLLVYDSVLGELQYNATVAAGQAWTRGELNGITLPANVTATYVRIILGNDAGSVSSAGCYVRDVQVNVGPVVGPYQTALTVANAFSSISTLQSAQTTASGTFTSDITTLNSQMGAVSASGQFRVETSSGPSGSDARIGLEVASSGSGFSYGAGLFLDAMSGGTSRATIIADQFYITDGSNNSSPFFFSGGTLYLDNASIQNLTADNITAGSIITDSLSLNAATDDLQSTSGATSVNTTGTLQDLATLHPTLVDDYSPVIINAFGSFTFSGATSMSGTVALYRDGSLINSTTSGSFNILTPSSWHLTIIDGEATAGGHDYTIAIQAFNQTGNTGYPNYDPVYGSCSFTSNSCTLSVVNFKR